MYTVVVADDERALRSALVEKVNWHAAGFEVVGQAENGAEALELVERLEPDLLLTDIRMPFLSGIDLARQVREIRPAMHIAFLSGYDDFSYARQAIQYNIISYMLKPMSSEQITSELLRIRKKMDEEQQALLGQTAEATQEELQLKKERFLMSLLLDGQPGDTGESPAMLRLMQNRAVEFGFCKDMEDTPAYVVLVTRLFERGGGECTGRQHLYLVDSIAKKYLRCGSFYSKGKVVTLLADHVWEFAEYLHIVTNEIIQSVQRMLNLDCVVGVSRETDKLSGCNAAYHEAIGAMEYSRTGTSCVRYIGDLEQENGVSFATSQLAVSGLERLLKNGEESEIVAFLNRLFDELTTRHARRADAELLLVQMVGAVCRAVSAVSEEESAWEFMDKTPMMGDLFLRGSLADRQQNFISFCLAARKRITTARKRNGEVLCDEVLHIINKEFGDDALSLVTVSERLHISSNYLSGLMKKVKGDTFVNLLTKRRMETARDLVLCSTMKMLEIAEKCGYSDQHYFSYCFKRHFGMSPNKLREQQRETDVQ